MSYDNSEPREKVGTEVQTWTAELGTRINTVVERLGGAKKSAELVGVSDDTVANWIKGKAKAPFVALVALADQADVTLDWLAFGRGPEKPRPGHGQMQAQSSGIDPELMGRVYDAIVRTYKDEGVSLPTIDAGRLAAEHYELVAASVEGPDDWPTALKMMAAQLRKAIHAAAAAPGSSKQRA